MNVLLLSGALAPMWMLVGVILVAHFYPGYSHRHQVMSELGARNRATTRIHPWINNFPIGFLFILFGIELINKSIENNVPYYTGILMMVQGVCHWLTGLFPCDEDLGVTKPSRSQKIHNLAGAIMYFSLLIACVMWAVKAIGLPSWFPFFSAASATVSIVTLVYVLRAMKTNINLGLYQRINYGALALWAMVLSGMLSIISD